MRILNPLFIAFSTYSRIPVPKVEWTDENRRLTMCFFPLIGVCVGIALTLWLALCDGLKIGALLRGAIGAMLPMLISGGIHMDGFMDACDALASWQTKERRLEILKDSHVGAFAVMGCCGYLLLDAAAFSEATLRDAPMLICVFVISRTLSACLMTVLKSARPGGMLDGFTRTAAVNRVTVSGMIYAAICIVVWIICGGWLGAVCAAVSALCAFGYKRMAYKQFGGVTGDLAGCFLQITELCLTAAIVIGGKFL